jgi:uncharacterized lipoprotein YddW (UPF0748 family)
MKVTPSKEPVSFGLAEVKEEDTCAEPMTKEQRIALRRKWEIENLVDELAEQIDAQSDVGEDAAVPVYQWAQQINSQITKAQGGSGPFRKRYMIVAELALRAVLVIDRSKS